MKNYKIVLSVLAYEQNVYKHLLSSSEDRKLQDFKELLAFNQSLLGV